jgi:hypothetical protein
VKYDPFWEVCEDLGVIIHFHSGPAPHPEYFGPGFPEEDQRDQLPGAMGIYVSEVMWWLYRPLIEGHDRGGWHHVHVATLVEADGLPVPRG